MKTFRFFYGVSILLAGMLFTACQDDLTGPSRYNDGKLHFKFSFDENGQWNKDNAQQKKTRLMAPIEITMPEGGAKPLYLHCEEANYIESESTAADTTVTRGQRITGEAFDNRGLIKCFGLYGRVGTSETSYEEVIKMDNEIQRTSLSSEKVNGWYEGKQDLEYADANNMWTEGKNGYFYGFAPFPGPDSDAAGDQDAGHARCIMTDIDENDVPIITFTMQPEEKKNKDILTAKTTTAYDAKGNGVEMQFHHVLSALKFKLNNTNDLKYTVGTPGVDAVEYYIHVKSLKLKGIYREGTANLGEEYTQSDPNDPYTRTSNWTIEQTDENKGDCEAQVTRTRTQITDGTASEETRYLVNTDENCFMVLPQTTPKGAKLIITADLSSSNDPTDDTQIFQRDATFEASLYNDGSDTGYEWKPGFTYTYTIKKDNIARKFTLDSKVDGTSGGSFSFTSDGGSKEFTVLSKVTNYNVEAGTSTEDGASWHIEYRENKGGGVYTDWQLGLPLGYTLRDKATNELVGLSQNIAGSTSEKTYILTAGPRMDASSTINTFMNRGYTGGPDGYYDLSTHAIGYGAASTSRNTANCYIVQGYGKFKLPLVYGNAIKNGVDNPISYKRFNTINHVFCNYKGNQITKPYINDDTDTDATGAKIVWQDHENIIREGSVKIITDTSDDISGSTHNKQYLCFEVQQRDVYPGNVLLAALDPSGNIMWSWHIWFMLQDYNDVITLGSGTNSMEMAKWNIGWRDPELEHATSDKVYEIRVVQNTSYAQKTMHHVTHGNGYIVIGGSNICYQHGRKDPFPNTVVTVKDYTTGTDGKISSITYELVDMFTKLGGSATFPMQAGNDWVEESIKHPSTVYRYQASGSDAYSNHWMKSYDDGGGERNYERYNTWDPDKNHRTTTSPGTGSSEYTLYTAGKFTPVSKTIFDPSPVGFVVPGCGLLEYLGGKSYKSVSTMTYDGKTVNAPIPWMEATDNPDIKLYRSGIRRALYNNYDNLWRNNYTENKGYNLADFFANNTNLENTHGFLWTAGVVYTSETNQSGWGLYIGIQNDDVRGPLIASATGSNRKNQNFYTCQGMPVRPIKDKITTVEAYAGSVAKEFAQETFTNVNLTRSETVGKTEKWGFDYTTLSQLKAIVENSTYSEKKVYIQNIVVTYKKHTTPVTFYGYNGLMGRVGTPHTLTDFYTKCYGETYGDGAFTILTSIDETHTFLHNDWTRASISSLTDWTKILNLDVHKMDIVSVKADLRISYIK